MSRETKILTIEEIRDFFEKFGLNKNASIEEIETFLWEEGIPWNVRYGTKQYWAIKIRSFDSALTTFSVFLQHRIAGTGSEWLRKSGEILEFPDKETAKIYTFSHIIQNLKFEDGQSLEEVLKELKKIVYRKTFKKFGL